MPTRTREPETPVKETWSIEAARTLYNIDGWGAGFFDILRSRIEALGSRFAAAIREFGYKGAYTTVYPIKVNQQRHVVEEIVGFGKAHGVGLECGSKPELQAVLALSESTDHIIVCNGYKDEEFMRLAMMGQK